MSDNLIKNENKKDQRQPVLFCYEGQKKFKRDVIA